MTTLRERLHEAMIIRRMKATDIAEKTGISRATISHYLSGHYEPKQGSIYKLARALVVDPAWLMGYDVPPEPERRAVPILGSIKRGTPVLVFQDVVGNTTTQDPSVDFLFRVPTTEICYAGFNGCYLYVSTQFDFKNGDLYLLHTAHQESIVRRVYRYGSTVALHPLGQNESISECDWREIEFVGKVSRVSFMAD